MVSRPIKGFTGADHGVDSRDQRPLQFQGRNGGLLSVGRQLAK